MAQHITLLHASMMKCLYSVLCGAMLCASAHLSARTVTFGDGAASTGWLDTGLLSKKSGARVAVIGDGLATPSGELVFELTVENPQKLSVGNTTLRVLGGNQGGRIDCRDFSDTSDDEWVRFQLRVRGACRCQRSHGA